MLTIIDMLWHCYVYYERKFRFYITLDNNIYYLHICNIGKFPVYDTKINIISNEGYQLDKCICRNDNVESDIYPDSERKIRISASVLAKPEEYIIFDFMYKKSNHKFARTHAKKQIHLYGNS